MWGTIAIHEAGHAVVAYLLRIPFTEVVLEKDGYDSPSIMLGPNLTEKHILLELVTLFSGICAAFLCGGLNTLSDPRSDANGPDISRINEIIQMFTTNEEDAERLGDEALGHALDLISDNFDIVVAVASDLTEKHLLTHRQVARIVNKKLREKAAG